MSLLELFDVYNGIMLFLDREYNSNEKKLIRELLDFCDIYNCCPVFKNTKYIKIELININNIASIKYYSYKNIDELEFVIQKFIKDNVNYFRVDIVGNYKMSKEDKYNFTYIYNYNTKKIEIYCFYIKDYTKIYLKLDKYIFLIDYSNETYNTMIIYNKIPTIEFISECLGDTNYVLSTIYNPTLIINKILFNLMLIDGEEYFTEYNSNMSIKKTICIENGLLKIENYIYDDQNRLIRIDIK